MPNKSRTRTAFDSTSKKDRKPSAVREGIQSGRSSEARDWYARDNFFKRTCKSANRERERVTE